MMITDTHTHLDFPQFDEDRDEVIARAQEAGVGLIINVGADLESSRRSVALAERYPHIYAAVGVHPHDARTVDDAALEELHRLAQHPKVVAIGEIGLDYYRDLSPRDVQRRIFRRQLELARELDLPVIIHDRDAHADVMKILNRWRAGVRARQQEGLLGVFHCFSGDAALAEQVVRWGFYVGIDGPITYPKAIRLAEVVRRVPLKRLLLETDCPYLTPQPHRGRRNEPAYVRLVAEAVARIRGVPVEEIAQATTANVRRLFEVQ